MTFTDIVNFLNQGWVSLIWGVILTYVGYRIGRRRAQPRALIDASHELTWGTSSQLPKGFELKFHDREIPRISRGMLRIWNSGSDTLMGTAIVDSDPLRLEVDEGEFLVWGVVRQTNAASQCKVESDSEAPKSVKIKFDFLDPGQGLVLGFLHTGSAAVPHLRGTLRGHSIKIDHKQGGLAALWQFRKRISKMSRLAPYAVATAGALMLSLSMLPDNWIAHLRDAEAVAKQPSKPSRFLFASAGAAYLGLAGFMLWARRRKYPKSLEFPVRNKTGAPANERNP